MSPQGKNTSLVKTRGVVILALGLVFAILAYKAVSRLVEKPLSPPVRAVMAVEPTAAGEPLFRRKLEVVTRPAGELPAGTFSKTEQVAGRIAARPIEKGTFVTNDHLVTETTLSQQSISRRLSPGRRAYALKVDEASGISGELVPGDLVDIIATSALSGALESRVSRVLLRKITVLSVRQEKKGGLFPGGSDKTGRVTAVTLAVNPDEANVLAASEGAGLRLVARSRAGGEASDEEFVYSPLTGPRTVSELHRLWRDKDLALNRRIPHGMRAVTVQASVGDGICGRLAAGNKVDVIAVTQTGDLSTEGDGPGATATQLATARMAKTIFQNVELMAVEDELDGLPGTPEGDERLVALLLSPRQAEGLISVSQDAAYKLKIVRRNPADTEITDTQGEKIRELFFEPGELVYQVEVHRRGGVEIENFKDPRVQQSAHSSVR